MKLEILAGDYRNGILENIHPGHICGLGDSGSVMFEVGDTGHMTFLRSALKPVQAIPAISHGIQEHFNLTDRETALFAASHRGEPFHIEQLERLMEKLGVDEETLLCHPAYPLNPGAAEQLIKNNLPKRRLYHNCSGKHLGMIGLAKLLGEDTAGYYEPEHPVQQEIVKALSSLSGCPEERIEKGVDGCGLPVYALPLNAIAAIYQKFVRPELVEDPELRNAVISIGKVMNEHADIISGSEAICTALLQDGNIIAKGGAQGVYCFGLKDQGIGFALKVMDGTEDNWPIIVASILEQIDYPASETIERLYSISKRNIFNDNNKLVGVKKATFSLRATENHLKRDF